MITSKKEVIKRLCKLVTEVGSSQFGDDLAHDCFCGENTFVLDGFRIDNKVIEFIENAVREKIKDSNHENH